MQSHVHRQAPLRLIAGRHAMQRRASISMLSMWNRWDQLPPPAPTVESGMGRLAETSRESKLTPRKYVQPFVADEIRCIGRLDPAAGGPCSVQQRGNVWPLHEAEPRDGPPESIRDLITTHPFGVSNPGVPARFGPHGPVWCVICLAFESRRS